jgi:hypothetical protein
VLAVSDFAEEIRRRVEAARDAAGKQRHADERHAMPQEEQLERRKTRAKDLCAEIDQRFTEAAQSSSGAMVYDRKVDHYGRVTSILSWQEPAPRRGLKIYVNPTEGVMDWSWVVNSIVARATRIDPAKFESVSLQTLILSLSDQEAWAKGQPPEQTL